MIFSLIVMIVVTIAAVLFSTQNPQMVQVLLVGYAVDGPLGLFLIIALGVGILIGVILMMPSLIKHQWSAARRQKQLSKLVQRPIERPAKSESSDK